MKVAKSVVFSLSIGLMGYGCAGDTQFGEASDMENETEVSGDDLENADTVGRVIVILENTQDNSDQMSKSTHKNAMVFRSGELSCKNGHGKKQIASNADLNESEGTLLDIDKDGVPDGVSVGDPAKFIPFGKHVQICHRPPGNVENAKEHCVGKPAVKAHLDHGDSVGPCKDMPASTMKPSPVPTPWPEPTPSSKPSTMPTASPMPSAEPTPNPAGNG